MLKKSTTNTFDQGLLMDMNPIVTPNNVVTNCLNGTLITYNGNEYVLQNDMGNGRVETAYLPEGYIPMGTAELGGIIYIVSYNPLKGMCQIGSFPSPERNLTSDEFQEQTASLSISNFYKKDEKDEEDKTSYTYKDSITSTQQRLILSDKFIYPGDKFQISSVNLNPSLEYLSAFCTGSDKNQYLNPKYLKLSVISISEEGKYENLNDNLIWYPLQDEDSESGTEYYIRNIKLGGSDKGKVDLSEYRSLTQSNYNIFQGSEKGKLGILAELECIDTFSCGYNISQEVYPLDNTKIRYSPKLYLNWTYTNPVNSNKINLYGVRVRLYQEKGEEGEETLDKTQYIIIPFIYSLNGTIDGGDSDICKYPNNVEFLNYNSDIPEDLKRNLNKIAEFGAATDKYEWMRLNKSWISIMGWGDIDDPDNLKKFIEQRFLIPNTELIKQHLSPRQNDGTDLQIEINLSAFNLDLDTINSNNILHLEVTPLMPFGAIEYLTQKYTLDLQKIGTGTFDFVRYQYYNYENENIMNIGINTYPEEEASFQDLSVEFYSLTQDMYDRLVKTDTNSHLYNGGAVFDNCNTIIQGGEELWANKQIALNPEIVCDVISGKDKFHVIEQYIGILPNAVTISLNPDDFADSQIEICKISFKYAKGEKVNIYSYYRIYFSNNVFNNVNSSECADFSVLKFPIRYNITYNPKVEQPSLKSEDYPLINRFDLKSHSTNTKYSLEYSYNIDINSSLNFINDQIIYTGSYTSDIELNDIIIDQYTQKKQGDIEANIEDIPTIEKEDDSPNKYKIASSFYAVYNTRTDDYTLGSLVSLEIGTAYLNFLPDKQNLYIRFSTEYSYEGGTMGTPVVIPDEERGKGVIIDSEQGKYIGWNYTLSTQVLKDLLENKDLLIIQGCLFGAFKNDYDGTKIRIYLEGESIDTIENVEKGHDFIFIFLLAFLDANGQVRIFSLNPQGYTTCLYFENSYMSIGNRSFSSPFDYGRDPDDSDNATQWSTEWPLNDKIENFKRLFTPYYKIDTSDQRQFDIYTSSATYYDDYILNGTITNTGEITNLKVTYNKIEIESNERINNLNYPDSIPILTEQVINISLPEIDYTFFTDPNRQRHYIYDLDGILTSVTYDQDYLFYTGNLKDNGRPYLQNDWQNSIRFPTKKDKDLADTSQIPPIPYEWVNINDWVGSAIHGRIIDRYYRINDLSEITFPQTFIFIQAELSNSDGQNMTLYGLNTINVFSE